jgi:tetratricopeptide (TPR) repeat protein
MQNFIQFFNDLNEKAIASMNKDEPEVALEFLKRVDDTLKKLEDQLQTPKNNTNQKPSEIDSNYKAALHYNLACCYQRLGMLEECVDCLELATKSLARKIQ